MAFGRAARYLLMQLIYKGVDAGIDTAFGAEKGRDQMTAEERRRHGKAKANARRARKSLRMFRRFGKF